MEFNIVKGNIVNIAADAVVLPANEGLVEGSGTSSAIFTAAGRSSLRKACRDRRKKTHPKTGSAVVTLAYNLNAKYIIHAIVPRWNKYDIDSNYALLSSAYLTSLAQADAAKCESILFPLLCAGNNKFDAEIAFKIASESIKDFNGTYLKKVTLVIFDDNIEVDVIQLGYEIEHLPKDSKTIANEKEKQALETKANERFNDFKKTAIKIVDDQIEELLDWLNNKENIDNARDWIFDKAFYIAKKVLHGRI